MTSVASALLMPVTWALWAAVIIGLGAPIVRLVRGRGAAFAGPGSSMWFGLWLLIVVVLGLSLTLPLGGRTGLIIATVLAGLGLVGPALMWTRSRRVRRSRLDRADRLLLVALGIVFVLAWFWAAGEPTNYDTGLYHLGSIAYASDYSAIPGLANLHDRFGFNSSMWPLAALLGTGAWQGEGFRLVVGLILSLVVVDVVLRIRRGDRGPGTVLLTAGLALSLAAIAHYPGRLMSSSAQDSVALLLALVSTAYLVDALSSASREDARLDLMTAVAVAVTSGTVRPVGWVFAAGTGAVALWICVRGTRCGRTLWGIVGLTGIPFVLMLARDALLSGWLLFPLSLFPVQVDWRAVEPTQTAQKITAWARTPFQDFAVTLADDGWFVGWLQRMPTDWGALAAFVLTIVAVAWLPTRPGRAVWRAHRRVIVIGLVPTALTLIAWFLSAPDPRFAWGYLLSVGLVPIGVLVSTTGSWPAFTRVTVVTVLALLAFAAARGTMADLSLGLRPPVIPLTAIDVIADGTRVTHPIESDQCWRVYPLCTPDYMSDAIERRGPSIGDGFRLIEGVTR